MVNFDNFGGLTSVLKFHIFLIFNCEESVRIRVICEGLVRFFSDVKNRYSIFTNVKNRYQFFTIDGAYCGSTSVVFSYLALLFLIKKSFTDIDIEKLATPPGGHVSKQSNNLNNIGRGCPMNYLCLILLKSDQKFLTRF